MKFRIAWDLLPKSLILPLVTFLIRVSIWPFGLWRILKLIEYDGDFYISLGRSIVSSLMNGDYYALLINPIHPPLGKIILGLFSFLFDPVLGTLNSDMLLMCIISALTSLLVFKIGCALYGERGGLIAWAIYSLDPFSIHWTVAWLDTPTLLFITLAQYLLLRREEVKPRLFVLALLSYYLALMTKFQAVLFLPAMLIFLKRNKERITFITASLVLFFLNPQFMIRGGLEYVISENISLSSKPFQELGSPANLLLLVPVEVFYRLCVGYVGTNVLPYLAPLMLFYYLFWRKSNLGDELAARWFSLTLFGVILTPRLLLQEYYYVYTTVPISLLLSSTMNQSNPSKKKHYMIKMFSMGSLFSITSFFVNPSCWEMLLLYITSM